MHGACRPHSQMSTSSQCARLSRTDKSCRFSGLQFAAPLVVTLALFLTFNVQIVRGARCSEEVGFTCDVLAWCEDEICMCPEGVVGDGLTCSRESWTVRFMIEMPEGTSLNYGRLADWNTGVDDMAAVLTATPPDGFSGSMQHSAVDAGAVYVTINALFADRLEADAARESLVAAMASPTPPVVWGVQLNSSSIAFEPRVYSWVYQTSSAQDQILPTGMDVQNVYFKTNCATAGCWAVDIIFTLGKDNFNVFYLPHAEGDDTLSEDFNYNVRQNLDWSNSPADTFLPKNFPCGSMTYVPGSGANGKPPHEVTACCIPEFVDLYRPIQSFVDEVNVNYTECNAGNVPIFARPGWSNAPSAVATPSDAMGGPFKGMPYSTMQFTGVMDPYIRQYTATIFLDEVELRQKAGILTGTVGVEYTVDTFIGLANFKPTGLPFLDMFAMQVNIHLEKTSFFSVATHGENQYTFLEYVNLRLVAVYQEDTDLSETVDEQGEKLTRTNSTNAAHYVQVTFTLGAQYQPIETGVIPIDSVRVGKGDFFTAAATQDNMFHACSDYLELSSSFPREVFDSRFPQDDDSQSCAPNATMCKNPESIPDQFVSFNIPLGVDWMPEPAGGAGGNVFVDMVVSVIDQDQINIANRNPNQGDPAEQMKTTLTASIPVVEGGVNIFCDGLVAKTDLKDVANVDLIIGSAGLEMEMGRLWILEDIASSALDEVAPQKVDSDSIEAGLMTLIVKGNSSYFGRTGTGLFGLVVEDLITIHVMEDGTSTFDAVFSLLGERGDDNSNAAGLDTDGYPLNGAFYFTVDRVNNRASLQPSLALKEICSFNPTKPNPADFFPSTCVIRRDISARAYPARSGSVPTAIELPAATIGRLAAGRDEVAGFMQTVVGKSDYAFALGQNFSHLVGQRYQINGQYNRAFWINPGYEWTPAQTGGQEKFTLSQTLIMFALINIDEGFSSGRRMLVNNPVDPAAGTGAAPGAAQVQTPTTPAVTLAGYYEVPEGYVASFNVELKLTADEVCMSEEEQRMKLRDTLDEYLTGITTPFLTVQVAGFMTQGTEAIDCSLVPAAAAGDPSSALSAPPGVRRRGRISLRRRLNQFTEASAVLEMYVVFAVPATEGEPALINIERFLARVRVLSATPTIMLPSVQLTTLPIEQPVAATPAPAGVVEGPADEEAVDEEAAAFMGISLSSEMKMGLAVCGILLAFVGYKLWKKRQLSQHVHEVDVVTVVSVESLKATLQEENKFKFTRGASDF